MKRIKEIILIIFLLLCLALISCAGWKLYGYYMIYHDGREEYDELAEYTRKNDSQATKGSNEDNQKKKDKGKSRCPVKVDFESLKKINPDIVGWIHIPDTGINYPIVQAKDNTKYLHRTFRGKDSYVGAIFLDALCTPDFSSFNSIIYGHNLKNGEMFGHLKKLYDVKYNRKADYRKHPKIWIITPDWTKEYEIFAFREVSVDKDRDVYTIDLSNPKDRKEFIDKQIQKSQKETGINPTSNGRMITLSTCTSRTRQGRFVVQAIAAEN